MKLTVHLGAHKTATTHLQRILRLANPALQFENIFYWDRQDFRAKVTDEIVVWSKSYSPIFLLKYLCAPARYSNSRSRSMLAETLGQLGRCYEKAIISDENLLGMPNDIYNSEQLYGLIPGRVATLKTLFGGGPVDFCLAIRNPATFLPSIYCEALFYEGCRPFGEIYRHRPLHSLRWLPLIQALRDGLGGRSLTVWDYEDYSADKRFIVEWLTGVDTSAWDLLAEQTPRSSFSTRAVELVAGTPCHLDDEQKRKQWIEEVVAANPVSTTNPKFQPFSAESIDLLTTNYRQDVEEISQLSGVVLLKRPS